MKFWICTVLLVASASAAKLPGDVAIVSSNSVMNLDGSYEFSYVSEDGSKQQAAGNQKRVGPKPEDIGNVARGSYTFTPPEGGPPLTVTWVADENGFQATGDHLPTPPPMPPHVIKMLGDLKAAGLI